MMLKHIFSSNDSSTDSIAVCVVFGVFGLVALAVAQVVLNHAQIGITEAGTGIAAVIAAGGAVRVARDKTTPQQATPAASA